MLDIVWIFTRWKNGSHEVGRVRNQQGGREALKELHNALVQGHSVVIAVDGPLGPPFRVKPGCIDLAIAAGAPIISVVYKSKFGVTKLKRWDKMLLPRFFDMIEIQYGEPVEPTANPEAMLEMVQLSLSDLDPISRNA